MLRKLLIPAAFAGLLAIAPAAHAAVPVKINPKTPIVDDSVTASFAVKQPLKAGWHYRASILGASGYDCAGFVVKNSTRNPGKGRSMSFRFSSYDDILDGGPEWCQGKASVMISKVRDGDETGTSALLVGITSFRFVAMP